MLPPDAIVLVSRQVMPRVQPEGILLYQTRTDEMHVISPPAYALLRLCDGGRTVREVEAEVAAIQPEFGTPEGREQVERFLEALSERRIVELWS